MPTLSLGVIDVPYANPDTSPARSARQIKHSKRNDARAAFGAAEVHGTTGEVAQLLEDRYHVMEIFAEEHLPDIATIIEVQYGSMLEDVLSGMTPQSNSSIAAMGQITDLFHKFIDSREMDGIQPGVPTAASLKGINHRLLHPYAKGNPQRPSFKDTGTYEDHFWAEIQA